MLNYLFFLVIYFVLTIALIQNENDFIEELSIDNNQISLIIDSTIIINENITLPSTLKILSFIGNSQSTSKLTFNYPIYFNENIEEIEIKNIEIIGTLDFYNTKRITLENVVLNGSIVIDMDDHHHNEYIKFNKVIYRPIKNQIYLYCIDLKGNVIINDSKLYGGSCQRLLNYNGLEKYSLNIKNTYFSGEYQCPCLSITQSKNVNIEYSDFEKGFSEKGMDGG
ncbi:hypothetical protein BCR36DRAFT_286888 [Piromyces finnis]|uniref:Uncharacterized protein n=1 Tax=Piromyces finnis TaxID=1754191 RepID=A0A1Y1VBK1_9FUNG|nr:hypothetical protein BCR36DRAFT_286888 [Piromyces finnis]|eukprot:ORX52138.1 hypothetical protein BCR36DRAFT_286888 [Piromyces finnis]